MKKRTCYPLLALALVWRPGIAAASTSAKYGDGLLQESSSWVVVASDAVAVYSHTGHAVYLRRDGAVLGTGGNRNGPLGTHGYGDKAIRWGAIPKPWPLQAMKPSGTGGWVRHQSKLIFLRNN